MIENNGFLYGNLYVLLLKLGVGLGIVHTGVVVDGMCRDGY